MGETSHPAGYFVFSFDTELAWGSLWDAPPSSTSSRSGSSEREIIKRLLDILDEFGVAATWAITGHLFYERCEECERCPVLDLEGKDSRFHQIWKSEDSLWYGADIIAMLLSRDARHEIAYHGYTHRVFDALSRDEAELEITEWLRVARRKKIVPQTVIFPQDRISHLDLFRDAGFLCYRGNERVFSFPFFGKVLNRLNLMLTLSTPKVFEMQIDSHGLVNLPSSQWLFRVAPRLEALLDSLHLHTLRFRPTARAIDKAAHEKKIIHLWAHPHEFTTEKDLDKLRFVFSRFARHAKAGALQSITMAELARKALAPSREALESRSPL